MVNSKYPLNIRPVVTDDKIKPERREEYKSVLDKIQEISGINVYKCMQCGSCSAGCPASSQMEYSPAQIMKILQIGDFSKLEDIEAIWLCMSCGICLLRCPKGIDIAKISEAIRQVFLQKRKDWVDPSSISRERLRAIPQIALISCLRKFSS